ncbi:MAG: DUF3365 domain-containing protein [Rhodospirillales bacterium]|nr:DUF3365 domain-containing protein [Rhodospirillales bacterium]
MRHAASALMFGLLLAGGSWSATAAEDAAQARIEASRAVSGSFAAELKEALTKEMATGGPIAAVDVCKEMAPQIAARASEKTGWTVARTSLKPRNPASAPDPWEAETLQAFAARKAAGEDPAKLEAWTIADDGGRKRFRYMKAIPTASMCLACHGTDIDPELRAHLDTLYPEDAAVGYREGDIRGAFTITQPM